MNKYRVETELGFLYGYVETETPFEAAKQICNIYCLDTVNLVIFECDYRGIYNELIKYRIVNNIIVETSQ